MLYSKENGPCVNKRFVWSQCGSELWVARLIPNDSAENPVPSLQSEYNYFTEWAMKRFQGFICHYIFIEVLGLPFGHNITGFM
jgi:hypothetical protein